MDINIDSIEKQIAEQLTGIEMLKSDIKVHEYSIQRDLKEIKTKEWMIEQWRTAIGKLQTTN